MLSIIPNLANNGKFPPASRRKQRFEKVQSGNGGYSPQAPRPSQNIGLTTNNGKFPPALSALTVAPPSKPSTTRIIFTNRRAQ